MNSMIADIVIAIAALALLAAMGLTALSVWHSKRMNRRQSTENGVPTRNISLATAALTLVVALPTLMLGGLVDMFIITTAVLLIVAAILVACGRLRTLKRINSRNH